MGQLFDSRTRLDQLIKERKLDQTNIYGEVGLRAGLLISLLRANTPDDDAKLQNFRNAVQEVLQVRI